MKAFISVHLEDSKENNNNWRLHRIGFVAVFVDFRNDFITFDF